MTMTGAAWERDTQRETSDTRGDQAGMNPDGPTMPPFCRVSVRPPVAYGPVSPNWRLDRVRPPGRLVGFSGATIQQYWQTRARRSVGHDGAFEASWPLHSRPGWESKRFQSTQPGRAYSRRA